MTTNEIEDIIANWMRELAPPPEPYCTSLDAMAKAERKIRENLDLMGAYTIEIYLRLFAGQDIIQPDRNFTLLTCPPDIRAEALAKVIEEARDEVG